MAWINEIRKEGWTWKGFRLTVGMREVREYESVPKWYGVAYRPANQLAVVCWVMPLHLFVQGWRWFHGLLLIGIWPSRWEQQLYDAERFGKERALKSLEKDRREHYNMGYEAGIRHCLAAAGK